MNRNNLTVSVSPLFANQIYPDRLPNFVCFQLPASPRHIFYNLCSSVVDIKLCFAFGKRWETSQWNRSRRDIFFNQDEICLSPPFLRWTHLSWTDKLPVKFISDFWIKYDIYELFIAITIALVVYSFTSPVLKSPLISTAAAGDLTSCVCMRDHQQLLRRSLRRH